MRLAVVTLLLITLNACSRQEPVEFLQVISWSGADGEPVALDQVLKVEFDRPLARRIRPSSVELIDEGEHLVSGMTISVVGRWLYLRPRLPLLANLSDGSLMPNRVYGIRLHGLPWLRAMTSLKGDVLSRDQIFRFRTTKVNSPGALVGQGVDSSSLHLEGTGGQGTLRFAVNEPVLLYFTRGLDPRSLGDTAEWRARGGSQSVPVGLRLVENHFDRAVVEVSLEGVPGWGTLELPAGIEGLGGWPLPSHERGLRIMLRGKN